MERHADEISLAGFNRYIGPLYRLDAMDAGVHRFAFDAGERHMNAAGSVHGGMLMSFMDVAMSHTVRAVSGATRLSTVALNCDFVSPGRLGETIEARVRVSWRGRSVVFLSGELFADDRLLLVATGLWKVADSA